jgi:lysozyme family protein
MTASNFQQSLDFVWAPGRDSPQDGPHTTTGDAGGATFGGVIQASWNDAVASGLVHGPLSEASRAQLSTVLRANFWGDACDALPPGLDLLLFNGRMMTGRFTQLFQQALGFMGPDEVDGCIGPVSLRAASLCDAATLINAVSGAHHAYLAGLPAWVEFGRGWTARLCAAQVLARAMAEASRGPYPFS